ncbi:MAG: adenosine deaminase, partial [Deltaproteobacteria bacterium]|nr:adenosine deaminase [Deltaproteobacteria bacterium]
CEQDEELVARLVADQIPLTVCPLSNLALKVVADLREHNLARLLRRGLCVTVNSDDPAYFGGYVGDNYEAVVDALGIGASDVVTLAENSIRASFLDDDDKQRWLGEIARVAAAHR